MTVEPRAKSKRIISIYKNKMQAMGTIMTHFGASADGNMVKQVLQHFSA